MGELPKRPGLVFRVIDRWAARAQAKELQDFVAMLATLTDSEMAELAVVVERFKDGHLESGVDLMRPFDLQMRQPNIIIGLGRESRRLKVAGQHLMAAATVVWAHTLRACVRPSLLPLARLMWRELQRGASHMTDARMALGHSTKKSLLSDYGIEPPAMFDS